MKPAWALVLPWTPDKVGGVTEYVLNMLRQIDEAGRWRPILIVNDWSSPKPTADSFKGLHFIRLRIRSPEPTDVTGLTKYLLDLPWSAYRIWSFIRDQNVEIIQFQFTGLAPLTIGLMKLFRIYRGKLVLTYQGADLTRSNTSSGMPRLLHFFARRWADHIITYKSLRHLLKEENVGVIPAGINVEQFFSEQAAEVSLPAVDFILTVATFEEKKGLDTLISAFERVEAARSIHLVIAGRDTEYRIKLQEIIRDRDLVTRIKLLTDVPHCAVVSLFKSAKLFVLPSRSEPFGIVLLEAGACSLPVIATSVGGIPDIIEHMVTGILVDPDDPAALAEAISRLLNDANLRQQLGGALKQRILKDFTWRSSYEKHVDLFTNRPN